jgi:hypothetical protein
MTIRFSCPCGREIQARDEYAGTQGRCPTCGRVVDIPVSEGPVPPDPEDGSRESPFMPAPAPPPLAPPAGPPRHPPPPRAGQAPGAWSLGCPWASPSSSSW